MISPFQGQPPATALKGLNILTLGTAHRKQDTLKQTALKGRNPKK